MNLLLSIVTAVILALPLLATQLASAADNPGVLPPHASAYGRSYSEWSAAWWQWALSMPAVENPLLDETGALCANGQAGQVFFLAGVINVSGTAERTCAVPTGTAIFLPVLNVECSTVEPPPFFGSNEEELRACAVGFFDATGGLAAEIDGGSVTDLGRYRVQSPLFEFTLPEGNILGVPAGPGMAVSDGVWLLLAPLSAGEHMIHFTGTFTEFDFTLDITYHLNVG
jgi:hypothetical protein